MWLALQGDRTQQQLNQYAVNVVKKRLETIDGVGEVRLGGRRDRTIRVEPAAGAHGGVRRHGAGHPHDAFGREHVQLPGGFLVGEGTESLVKLDLEFHSLDELAQMIVAYRDGSPVRLRDMAESRTASPTSASSRASTARRPSASASSRWPTPTRSRSSTTSRSGSRHEIIPQLPPGHDDLDRLERCASSSARSSGR